MKLKSAAMATQEQYHHRNITHQWASTTVPWLCLYNYGWLQSAQLVVLCAHLLMLYQHEKGEIIIMLITNVRWWGETTGLLAFYCLQREEDQASKCFVFLYKLYKYVWSSYTVSFLLTMETHRLKWLVEVRFEAVLCSKCIIIWSKFTHTQSKNSADVFVQFFRNFLNLLVTY